MTEVREPAEEETAALCPLPREFFGRDGREVAPELLGKVLTCRGAAGRIVEVEAYAGLEDPGSHAYRGPTPRTEIMFGNPGFLYVYFSYGMHWCANAVCGPEGTASAVLIRALAPLSGLESMRQRRTRARRDRDLCSGPAKLCQALGIDLRWNGRDLVHDSIGLWPGELPRRISRSRRIGISQALSLPLRWFDAESRYVSRSSV